ncbi:hypothetical protein [Paraburkholderia sp. Cpub6]|uniref:hypothetical protein n=1 Tax=Paraburkholderia sp. Cpub6 TaxID=2723094 RepID=UPI001618EFF6|nr:hypothetical protein [Paraburkholderia sp. Cpub6]MBB5463625.1 hypothetical protein [Paraburkholderia sp. Cpub6]
MIVNIGANYLTRIGGHDVTLRAAIDNITNRRYWMFQCPDYIARGRSAHGQREREDRFLI